MTLTKEYADLQAQMDSAFDGGRLRRAAEIVLREIPAKTQTTFIATSTSGAGLAAACAALYEGPARWIRINLLVPVDLPANANTVVVEMVDGGEGWRHAVTRRVGPHTLVVPELAEKRLALA